MTKLKQILFTLYNYGLLPKAVVQFLFDVLNLKHK